MKRQSLYLELNDYFLKEDLSPINDQDLILNGILLTHQLDQTFVLLINNPENETLFWTEFLSHSNEINEEKANQGTRKIRINSFDILF